MKLINNRYRINEILRNESNNEEYLVNDLLDKENIKHMRIFSKEKDRKISSYFIENFLVLSQIRHKNILSSEHFGVVETINLRKTNNVIYYMISGYSEWDTLTTASVDLNLSHRLRILLEIMNTVDYIHFRGFVLKYLNPFNIYYSGNEIRLKSIAKIIENSMKSSYYGSDYGVFTAPEVLMNNDEWNYKADYFSIGMLMKQLLLVDIHSSKNNFSFFEEFNLNQDEKRTLANIIDILTHGNPIERDISLRSVIDEINSTFNLNVKYDLIQERNKIFLNNPLVGFKKEIDELLAIDDEIKEGDNDFRAIMIKGTKGIGKSKVLREFSFRLKMRGRSVYRIDLSDSNEPGLVNISHLIKMMIANQPESIVNRYLGDFDVLNSTLTIGNGPSHKNSSNKLNLFNKLCNFINEISREDTIYLEIKNFEKADKDFIDLIDYLFSYLTKNSLFMLFSFNENCENDSYVLDKINYWTKNKILNVFVHNPLNLDETGIMVKNILGISYVPKNFAKEVYNESKGNPSFIELFIKDLYDSGEIYMHSEGCWELRNKDLSGRRFPTTYSEMILNQLKKYDDQTLAIIKVLSIFNIKIPKSIIAQLTNIDLRTIDKRLEELLLDQIVAESIGESSKIYGLISEEISRNVYGGIDDIQRVNLHEKAADILFELYSSKLYHIRNELIFQLDKAKKADEAVELIIHETEKIVDKSSSSAIMLWELGYSLIESIKQDHKLILLDNLTYVYMLKGDTDKTYYYNEKLMKEARASNNIEYLVKAMANIAEGFIRKNDLDQLDELIKELEVLSSNWNFTEGIIKALILKAILLNSKDQNEDILPVLQEALDLCEKNSLKSYLGTIYNLQGIANNNLGYIGESIESYKKSIQMFEYSERYYEVIKPINNLGNIYNDNFDTNKAMEYYEEALEIAKKYGLIRIINTILNNIGEAYYDKLEYNKAMEYLYEASKLAEEGKEIRMKFTSDINLGLIDLNTNKFSNAYKLFKDLNKLNESNPIQEAEVKYKYINFLGKFYLSFGNYELSKEYTRIACEYFKELNIKEWLKTEARLIHIKYLKTGVLDREAVYSSMESYLKTDFHHDYLKFLLNIAKLALVNGEREFSWEIIDAYKEVVGKVDSVYLNYNYKIIERLLKGDEESLLEIEKSLGSSDADLLINSTFDLRLYLGNIYHERKKYSKALRQYLEALDNLNTTSQLIDDVDAKFDLIHSRKPELIKKRILSIINEEYKKDLGDIFIEKITRDNMENYFDFYPFINVFSPTEFYDIFHYEGNDIEIKSLSELLINLDDNYKENLKTILKFMCNETLASRGLIIVLDSETNTTEVGASLIPGDKKLPGEFVLLNSLRSKKEFLFNRSSKNCDNNTMERLMSDDLEGMMCVPITSYARYQGDRIDRRRWETLQTNDLVGYIYLETDSSLNRFDLVRYDLVQSLINILYLNIKNDSLRRISISDKVTSTFTRKYFEDRFEILMDFYKRTENSFSLLMIDIDKFKRINDTYGHQKGDKVLGMLGGVIRDSIRDSDLVGRYGGEEFILILNNTTTESGMEVAEKIRKNVEDMKVPGIDNKITVSIGLSQFPLHSTFSDELIAKADQALYYAKEILGRNKIALWYPGMSGAYNNVDKLTGLVTGDFIRDNNNLLALVDIAELSKDNKSYEEKAFDFLGRIVEAVNGQYASLILDRDKVLTRERDESSFTPSPLINFQLVNEVNNLREGRNSIDWENSELKDVENNTNWNSILLVPLIKNEEVKATLYITVPLKEKEFDVKDLNICNVLSNIFVGNL